MESMPPKSVFSQLTCDVPASLLARHSSAGGFSAEMGGDDVWKPPPAPHICGAKAASPHSLVLARLDLETKRDNHLNSKDLPPPAATIYPEFASLICVLLESYNTRIIRQRHNPKGRGTTTLSLSLH
jgi:hypothetical protein